MELSENYRTYVIKISSIPDIFWQTHSTVGTQFNKNDEYFVPGTTLMINENIMITNYLFFTSIIQGI